jgi:hypothetical protein
MSENTVKCIQLPTSKHITFAGLKPEGDRQAKTTALEYDKTKRVITATNDWNIYKHYLDISSQIHCIYQIRDLSAQSPQTPFLNSPQNVQLTRGLDEQAVDDSIFIKSEQTLKKTMDYIQQQLRNKRTGYRHQDVLKHIYDECAFVTEHQIVELLIRAEFKCFYCSEYVEVIYENVRHPKQWSLDRIDNSLGHNGENVEIACLACNLRRRTMYHERYVATKQMRVVVKV